MGDQLRCLRLQCDLFCLGDVLKPCGNVGGADAVKIIPLAAGNNGCRHLVHLSGRQNELDVFRRFLHDLQQCAPRTGGQHVHLVDDVYLITAALRQIDGALPQVTDILDAAVGSGIDLDDVAQCAKLCIPADVAGKTGITGLGAAGAVDRLCQNSCAGGLAGSTGAGEKIGMRSPTLTNLIAQCCGNMRL